MRHLSNPQLWTLLFTLRGSDEPEAAREYERASQEHHRRVAELRGRWKRHNVTRLGQKRLVRYFEAKGNHDDALRRAKAEREAADLAELARLEQENEALLARLADHLTAPGAEAPTVEA